MTDFLWGVYPYICLTLFFSVPLIRMAYRPYSWTTRASSLFNRKIIGPASLFLHWGIFLVFLGHAAGLIGGVLGLEGWLKFFYWTGLIGGLLTLVGSIVALVRRFWIPEARALSQIEDYVVLVFLITILGLALYQVIVQKLFGLSYTAASWFASLFTLSPQPELMASVSLIIKLHVLIALAFLAYFPFTKLVHLWTFPLNYFVRPYQAVRTMRYQFQRKWEYSLRSDKSFMTYSLSFFFVSALLVSSFLGRPMHERMEEVTEGSKADAKKLSGYALYVSQCARCHGNEGLGDGLGMSSSTFGAPPRNLVEGKHRFVSTVNGIASDQDLFQTLVNGLVPSGMPKFDALSDHQLLSLVSVLRTFWKDRPTPGESVFVGERPSPSEDLYDLGMRLYTANCIICHGPTGKGEGVLAEYIDDWQNQPVSPSKLAEGKPKTGRDPHQLYLRIAAGIPGGKVNWLMPPFGQGLSSRQIWALVSYLVKGFEKGIESVPGPPNAAGPKVQEGIQTAEERGRIIFIQQACFICHGPDGKGGIENPNYINDTTPPLTTMAEKMSLFYPEDAEAVIKIMNEGKSLTEVEDIDVSQPFLVIAKYEIVVDTIKNGRESGKKDPEGAVPINMPEWKDYLTDQEIRDVITYFLSTYPWEEFE